MKTAIWVLNINNYWPELCEITLPTLKWYAKKLDADFNLITERKYDGFPITYEKVQVHELGKEYQWNILLDADFLIHPLCPDMRNFIPIDTVGASHGYASNSWLDTDDIYFSRDGRNQGLATGLIMTSDLTHDLWEPLDMSLEEALTKVKRKHILDEYCLSRNLAKYGLKYMGIFQQHPSIRETNLIHLGCEEKTDEEKAKTIQRAKEIVESW